MRYFFNQRGFYRYLSCFIIFLLLNSNFSAFASTNNQCLAPLTIVSDLSAQKNINDLLFNDLILESSKTKETVKTSNLKQFHAITLSILNTFKHNFISLNSLNTLQKLKYLIIDKLKAINTFIDKTMKVFIYKTKYIGTRIIAISVIIMLLISACSDPFKPTEPDDYFEGGTIFSIGKNDNSSSEFLSDANSFDPVFRVNDQFQDKFPRELNNSWFKDIYIHFDLNSANDLTLYLDASWQNDRGALIVGVDFYLNGTWKRAGTVVFNSIDKGYIDIPASFFKSGLNEMRLSVSNTNGKTNAIYWDQITLKPTQYGVVPEEVISLANNITDVSLNYFLSADVLHSSGLPPTAFNAKDFSDFAWTNPTEWGYFMQAYIIAAETGKISVAEANTRITRTLDAIKRIQDNPDHFTGGLLYSFYELNTPTPIPVQEGPDFDKLSVGDCALLWLSLNTIQGWLISKGYNETANTAKNIMDNFNLRTGYKSFGPNTAWMVHSVRGSTLQQINPRKDYWDYFADEGGMVALAAFLSGAINKDEFRVVINTLNRHSSSWNGFTVEEAHYFNAAFAWIQRPASGVPFFEGGLGSSYGINSFIPAMEAYVAYGQHLNIDYPAFSDAMSQGKGNDGMVGEFYPPNAGGVVIQTPPEDIATHGLIVPFAGMRYLSPSALKAYYDALILLRSDINNIWHDRDHNVSASPYGFEVIAPPKINQDGYVAQNAGRYVFETLSQGYNIMSAWYGVRTVKGQPTFYDFAKYVPFYDQKLNTALNIMYGGGLKDIGEDDINLSPEQYRLLKNEIERSKYEEVEKVVNNNIVNYRLITTKTGDALDTIMKEAGITNGAFNLSINGKNYILLNKDIPHYHLAKEHEECEICCRKYICDNEEDKDLENLNKTSHKIAWGLQILNNKWKKAENVNFVKNQLDNKSISELVDILKEKRKGPSRYITAALANLTGSSKIKESIIKFEKSFQEYAYIVLGQKIIDTVKTNIKQYDIDLIKKEIKPIVLQTKDVIDNYSLRNMIFLGLKENNLIKNMTINIDDKLSKLTESLYKKIKNDLFISHSA